jgi:hypothetical protein
MIYLVLGMHKSGTTAIASVLNKSGIDMLCSGKDQSYDFGEKFENSEVRKINLNLLGFENNYSLKKISTTTLDESTRCKIIEFVNRNRSKKDWGFKDPRTIATYGIWKKFLPEHKLVCVFRDPLRFISIIYQAMYIF